MPGDFSWGVLLLRWIFHDKNKARGQSGLVLQEDNFYLKIFIILPIAFAIYMIYTCLKKRYKHEKHKT